MPSFKAKMHQIRFRLGLRPRPCWGSLRGAHDPAPHVSAPPPRWNVRRTLLPVREINARKIE